jgi:hypothetical protein
MAQTKKQAEKELLKQAKALLAKKNKELAQLQSSQSVNTSDYATRNMGFQATGAIKTPQQVQAQVDAAAAEAADDAYFRNKLGTTGLTQGQIDAQTNAIAVAKSIGGTVIPNPDGPGLKVVAPTAKKSSDDDDDNPPPPPPPGSGGGDDDEPDKPKEISDATRDAFAALADLFTSYGLESLAGEISGYMTQGLTAGEALIKLKTNPAGAYAKRFAGNFTRVKNGLNAISEAAYIGLENSYAQTLKDFGLGNMVSLNREDNYKKFADYISGDISADEFKDRVKTVVTRVQNADPSIKATLKSFYPEISDNDLVSYFLSPKENLPKLQEKVTASEIGAAATGA